MSKSLMALLVLFSPQVIADDVESLIREMTLEEKIGQLTLYSAAFEVTGPRPTSDDQARRYDDIASGRIGSMLNVLGVEATRKMQELAVNNSRLGIPLIFGYDVIHGYRTQFPIPLAEAASWDLDTIEHSARLAAVEASAAGLHWAFAPMIDMSRDARWGRVMEGGGEDPWLASRIAAARVTGFQGSDLGRVDTIAACAKHLAGYGFAEAGREYNTVDISGSTLYNIVLPPFEAAVDAGVRTIMSGFHDLGGIPAVAHEGLQAQWLKSQQDFDGFIVTDWGTIGEMIDHGVAANEAQAAMLAINAGNDMDMESFAYYGHLEQLVEAGQVPIQRVDDAVRRVLRVKQELGLLDDPFQYANPQREQEMIGHADHRRHALEAARKSIVLLKNNGILPLQADVGSELAIIGPLADDKDSPLGSWRAQAMAGSAVSVLEGVRKIAGSQVPHARGPRLIDGDTSFVRELAINTSDPTGMDAAVALAKSSKTVILVLGEHAFQSGEGRSRTDIGLPGYQQELYDRVREVNDRVIVVLTNGRPLAIPRVAETAAAIIEAWHLGSESGTAIADVLFGKHNPSGRLPMTFPRSVGQVPIYYNRKSTGRPDPIDMVFWSHYSDLENEGQWPFGYGLSYTTFEYQKPELSADTLQADGVLEVHIRITNTGTVAGIETVQLYLHDPVARFARPTRELRGFARVALEPGESTTAVIRLSAAELGYYSPTGQWLLEPGRFIVHTGPNALETQSVQFDLQ